MMKTAELTGPALDWAVAKCEGLTTEHSGWQTADGRSEFYFSTNWAQGGPIIERENITLERYQKMRGCAVIGFIDWKATHPKNYGDLIRHIGYGPTPLIAAMRCYVASKMGDEVGVPEELK